MDNSPYIEFKDVSFSYPDSKNVLKDINLNIYRGEKVAIIGPNGAGKSTLILHCNAILKGSGEVFIDNILNTDKNFPVIRRKVGIVFQDPNDQLFCPTVFDDIAFGPLHFGFSKQEIRATVSTALKSVDLEGFEKKSSHHLSIGEKKRVAIASVLACEPEVLIFDEPSANLDPRRRKELIAIINSMKKTIIIATHDLDLVLNTCDRSVIINQGRIVVDGNTREILSNERLLKENELELPLSLSK